MIVPVEADIGRRVTHPSWMGFKQDGELVAIPNGYQADVMFDGGERPMRALQQSLVWAP